MSMARGRCRADVTRYKYLQAAARGAELLDRTAYAIRQTQLRPVRRTMLLVGPISRELHRGRHMLHWRPRYLYIEKTAGITEAFHDQVGEHASLSPEKRGRSASLPARKCMRPWLPAISLYSFSSFSSDLPR